MATDVKSKPPEEQVGELWIVVDAYREELREQKEAIRQLRTDLAQEQQANAALAARLTHATESIGALAVMLRGVRNAIGSPIYTGVRRGALTLVEEVAHNWERASYAPYRAAEAGSGIPQGGGPAPEHAGALVDGTGTGNPPVPPRYEASVAQTLEVLDGLKRVLRKASAPTRPGAMHRGSSGLPATGARRS